MSSQQPPSRYPIYEGVIFGVLAYIAGYLLTYHFFSLNGYKTAEGFSNLTAAGWYFYGAHKVPVTASVTAEEASRVTAINALEYAVEYGSLSGLVDFVWLIPPIVMLFAGVLACVGSNRGSRLTTALVDGSSIFIGYGLAAVIASFLFIDTPAAPLSPISIQPSIPFTIAYMTIYPALVGALGGTIYFFSQGSVSIQIRSQ